MKAHGGDPAARVLLAQWEFDSRLMAQALQSNSVSFPHFSLHDASHSESILAYVGKVLGNSRIAKLSATDLWMMLSAAYYHDSGMIVGHQEAVEWYEKGDLLTHIHNAAKNPNAELHKEAELIVSRSTQAKLWPFEVRRALTLLIADFVRPKHADRASQVTWNPGIHDIASPRTSLIPARLWRLLGAVCTAHGESFQAILKLPCAENGVFSDDAHPRFIAAFLRLGDLLDLDNGRFCPTLALTFGAPPPSTIAHRGKHASIRHFRVDESIIEVDAECESDALDAFDATNHWFTLLQNELRDLSYHWKEISPTPEFGAPPAAGQIEVRMPDQVPGFTPRFALNTTQVLSRFRNSGLYTSPYEAVVRELLQNAHDATTMRLAEMGRLRFELPTETSKIRDAYADLPIYISLTRKDVNTEEVAWTLTIKDSGVGMSMEDVKRTREVGTSNLKKIDARDIPEFLWPSGAFGIGLQSAFFLSDKVEIKTRSARGCSPLHVTFERDRGIIVRTWKNDSHWEFGTEVSLTFSTPRIMRNFQYTLSDSTLTEVMKSFDPLSSESELPVDTAKLIDAITTCSSGIFSKVIISLPDQFPSPTVRISEETIYKSGISIIHGHNRSHYRGFQIRDEINSPTSLADWGYLLHFGIYYGHSHDILTLNRERLRPECRSDLYGRVQSAFTDYIRGSSTADRIEFRSWLMFVLRTNVQDPQSFPRDDEEWRKLNIAADDQNPILLREVEQASLWIWEEGDSYHRLRISVYKPIDLGSGSRAGFTSVTTLAPLLPHIEYHGRVGSSPLYRLSTNAALTYDILPEEYIKDIVKRVLLDGLDEGVGHRWLVPVPARWAGLAIRNDVTRWSFQLPLSPMPTCPLTVLPFRAERQRRKNSVLVTVQNIERVAPWIRENSAQASPGDVESLLIDFMRHIDRIITDLASDLSTQISIACTYDLETEIQKIEAAKP